VESSGMAMRSARSSRLICGLLSLMLTCFALGQDRPEGPSGEELQKYYDKKIVPLNAQPTAQQRAEAMLRLYEFVGTGRFVIDDELNARDVMQPRNVVVEFRIDDVYKGAEGLTSIKVDLNSDMLAVPNERVSGYEKRTAAWRRLDNEGERNRIARAKLDQKVKEGQLTQGEYEKQRSTLEMAEQQRVEETLRISSRTYGLIHGKSFYDLGGSIQPGETYVLAASRARDRVDVYVLEENVNANLYWGELGEDVTAALNQLRR
jgi:hypothetical protein